MEDLIVLLAKEKQVTDDHIKEALYEICDRVHSSCDSKCPVYRLNRNKKVNRGCDCFKSGANMLEFIRYAT